MRLTPQRLLVVIFLLSAVECAAESYTFDARAPDEGTLGLELGDTLAVLGFKVTPAGRNPALHLNEGVELNDVLIAVNGEVSKKMSTSSVCVGCHWKLIWHVVP